MDVYPPKRIYVEVVSDKNPIQFDLSAYGSNITTLELEAFYYDQGPNPTIKYIGAVMQGCREHFNEVLQETNCLKTFASTGGVIDWQSEVAGFAGFTYNQGAFIEMGFINRDGGSLVKTLNSPPIAFTSNYLLNIVFEVDRQ